MPKKVIFVRRRHKSVAWNVTNNRKPGVNINTEIESLITLLQDASDKTAKLTGGYSGNHLSVEEFHTDLVESINKLKQKDLSVVENLWGWFAPTCQWDDFVGDVEFGDSIFSQIDRIRQSIK